MQNDIIFSCFEFHKTKHWFPISALFLRAPLADECLSNSFFKIQNPNNHEFDSFGARKSRSGWLKGRRKGFIWTWQNDKRRKVVILVCVVGENKRKREGKQIKNRMKSKLSWNRKFRQPPLSQKKKKKIIIIN